MLKTLVVSIVGTIFLLSCPLRLAWSKEIRIPAENVVIKNVDNNLVSTNLQKALDLEIAPKQPKNIVGKWQISNVGNIGTWGASCSEIKPHSISGTITFNADGTYALEGGYLAAVKVGELVNKVGSVCHSCGGEIGSETFDHQYTVLGKRFLMISYMRKPECGLPSTFSAMALIVAHSANELLLYTNDQASILTKGIP